MYKYRDCLICIHYLNHINDYPCSICNGMNKHEKIKGNIDNLKK